MTNKTILFTINGASGSMWAGYQWDLAAYLTDPTLDILAQFFGPDYGVKYYAQPIGYDSFPFPMQRGTDLGVRELVRQLTQVWPTQDFAFSLYSMGAIVGSTVLDLLRGVKSPLTARFGDLPDITHRYAGFRGAIAFGNPRREQGSVPRLPGAIDPGGHGIVTPNIVDTPSTWWDFAAGKRLPGSPGQDLYTTCGYDGDAYTVADEEAVWAVVNTASISSVLGLAEKVLAAMTNPIHGGVGAVTAILDTLDFFILHGLTPHTSYQFTIPVAGDPRDCWGLALQHLADIVGQSLWAPPP